MSQRFKFKQTGKDIAIYEPVEIINPDAITLHNHIIISAFAYLAAGLGLYIGNFIHLAAHSCISGGGYCILEDFVGVCSGVRIVTGTDDISGNGIPTPTIPKEYADKYRSYYKSFVHCKRHSFLATNVIVHPGVTIGEGAVVGSGSVVTKDLGSWGIYMGVPAKKIKERPKKKILELEKELYSECNLKPADFSHVLGRIKNGSQNMIEID
jgi:galactoside O-acetyltransferase